MVMNNRFITLYNWKSRKWRSSDTLIVTRWPLERLNLWSIEACWVEDLISLQKQSRRTEGESRQEICDRRADYILLWYDGNKICKGLWEQRNERSLSTVTPSVLMAFDSRARMSARSTVEVEGNNCSRWHKPNTMTSDLSGYDQPMKQNHILYSDPDNNIDFLVLEVLLCKFLLIFTTFGEINRKSHCWMVCFIHGIKLQCLSWSSSPKALG